MAFIWYSCRGENSVFLMCVDVHCIGHLYVIWAALSTATVCLISVEFSAIILYGLCIFPPPQPVPYGFPFPTVNFYAENCKWEQQCSCCYLNGDFSITFGGEEENTAYVLSSPWHKRSALWIRHICRYAWTIRVKMIKYLCLEWVVYSCCFM